MFHPPTAVEYVWFANQLVCVRQRMNKVSGIETQYIRLVARSFHRRWNHSGDGFQMALSPKSSREFVIRSLSERRPELDYMYAYMYVWGVRLRFKWSHDRVLTVSV